MSLIYYVIIFLTANALSAKQLPSSYTKTIMLNPDGDARTPGRMLDDGFERGITMQYAETIKTYIMRTYPHINVVLTRMPRESLEPLQKANFANRLHVDLYVSLHAYKEYKPRSQIYIYTYLYDTFNPTPTKSLNFCPYDQAYRFSLHTTQKYVQIIENHLRAEQSATIFDIHTAIACPFAPLIGIQAPACALEIGIKEINDMALYIQPLSEALCAPLS